MLGPKNTALDVAAILVKGLTDGSIVLTPSDAEPAANGTSPHKIRVRDEAYPQGLKDGHASALEDLLPKERG
jgi:hypothetical protein